jgi:Mg2+/Co2+ transporter CorC
MSDQSTGNTGRWLKRITQSMSGEPRDLPELIEDLREASERGLFNSDALVMIEGVLAVADMQVRDIMVPRAQRGSGQAGRDHGGIRPLALPRDRRGP